MSILPRLVRVCLVCLCCPVLPALGDDSDDLRSFFEGLDAGAAPEIAGHGLSHPALLSAVYRNRQLAPIWTGDGPLDGHVPALLSAIDGSAAHGFDVRRYHRQALEHLQEHDRDSLALELLASDALLGQAIHRSAGTVSPAALDPDWHLVAPEIDPTAVLASILADPAVLGRRLDALWPDSEDYRALVAERARILALGDLQVEPVPAGPLLRPGQSNERILALKRRLLGPGEYAPSYDADLREAVTAFQRAAGLEPDGIVGEATLEVMNASRFSWIDRIDANLERWRWLPADEPDTYVQVNIAAFSLRVIRRREDVLRMDVIVGRPYRRTPVFTETIKYMVFNPYWNVPYRLAVQDKLPALKADPAMLAAQGFEVRLEGQGAFVPVTDVDWSAVTRAGFRHLLRQRPGPQNALGQIKFMLPNPHAVYLHDTPARDLFSKQERSFSSGCVRLSRPLELAAWILENDGNAQAAAAVNQIVERGETTTRHLKTPLPAYLVYFTAFTDEGGDVVFRRDLYQRDAAIVAALRGKGPS